MSAPEPRVVILGAGHAGGMAAANLRQYGFQGPITLIGEEPIAPYQRPPLSKAWLKGEADEEALTLKPVSFYGEHAIDLRLGERAAAIDRDAREVALDGGGKIAFDHLILAMGARPRRLALPGADLAGVMVLRTAADAEALKLALGPGKRIAVVGGGYIGLEVAASARALGAEAVVIEREPRLLARTACSALSDFFERYHRERGVAFELGAVVTDFAGAGGHVTGVVLGDGRTVDCDVVLVGVGAATNDELAQAAGLQCSNGIVVDEASRTADAAIFAIGDVSLRPLPLYGRLFRPESVPSALEQAKQAAAAIAGRPAPAPEAPWNWSDQYDLKMQIAGLAFDSDETLLRGDPDSGRFAVFHLKGDRVLAVEAINAPAEFMGGKQLILSRKPIDRLRLADASVSMKEVAA